VTVEVDTPAGPRNGRGVVETRARERNEVLYTLDSAQLIVHGEAIAVALPTDPRSAEEVPQADDLSVVAATGFKVRRIGVQETDAPI